MVPKIARLAIQRQAEMENLANFLIDWPSARFAHQTKLISFQFPAKIYSKLFITADYRPDSKQHENFAAD